MATLGKIFLGKAPSPKMGKICFISILFYEYLFIYLSFATFSN